MTSNGFHAALELAAIQDFAWHDLRHTFTSWLMMRGASLRSWARRSESDPLAARKVIHLGA